MFGLGIIKQKLSTMSIFFCMSLIENAEFKSSQGHSKITERENFLCTHYKVGGILMRK